MFHTGPPKCCQLIRSAVGDGAIDTGGASKTEGRINRILAALCVVAEGVGQPVRLLEGGWTADTVRNATAIIVQPRWRMRSKMALARSIGRCDSGTRESCY